jgi:hypothetical protein
VNFERAFQLGKLLFNFHVILVRRRDGRLSGVSPTVE